ncbi:unnamed protein product [Gadus morhua 'NCC']
MPHMHTHQHTHTHTTYTHRFLPLVCACYCSERVTSCWNQNWQGAIVQHNAPNEPNNVPHCSQCPSLKSMGRLELQLAPHNDDVPSLALCHVKKRLVYPLM